MTVLSNDKGSKEIELFCAHLRTRNYSAHTIENYALDLRLFFAFANKGVAQVTWREVDRFIEQQHQQELTPTTINRRLNALKRFYDFLVIEKESLAANPVKPSHHQRCAQSIAGISGL